MPVAVLRTGLAAAGAFVALVILGSPASAQVALADVQAGSSVPSAVQVGQTVPAAISIQNTSTPSSGVESVSVGSISFVPACGTVPTAGAGNAPNCSSAESGVFAASATGSGQAGTSCAGITFDIGAPNASGVMNFEGRNAWVLGPAPAQCVIAFSLTVGRVPTVDVAPGSPGVQTSRGVRFTGVVNGGPLGGTPVSSVGTGTTTIGQDTPSIVGTASPGGPIGTALSDAATLDGATNPTGTITFSLWGPNNATCTGPPVFTDVVPVNGNGTYTSSTFTPTTAGTYLWVVAYSGDANNAGVGTLCNDPGQSATITAGPPPAITTQVGASPASRPEPGGSFTFTVSVQNTGPVAVTITSLTDNIYGDLATRPGSTCGTLIGASLAPGTSSAPCTFTGTFTGTGGAVQTNLVNATAVDPGGVTATDSDDASVSITAVPISFDVQVSASPTSRVAPGGDFTFSVTVTNAGAAPVTIVSLTDDVFGNLTTRPASTCGTAVGTVLAASGGAYSCAFTAPFTGGAGASQTNTTTATVQNSSGVTATDTDPATVTITPQFTAAVAGQATPTVATVGQQISDVARVTVPAGAPAPTGTVTFTLFGPDNPTCTGPPVFTSPNRPLSGSPATANSGPFTPTVAGTYRWVAIYSGDANYAAASTNCGAAGQTATVNAVSSQTSLVSSRNPSAVGQVVTFTATVSHSNGTAAAGSVVFKDGATTLGTIPVSSGTASFTTTTLAVGTHAITATYQPSGAGVSPSTSPTLNQVVNRIGSTTTVSSSRNPSTVGQSVTFTARVTRADGAAPAGNVVFRDGSTVLATVPLSSGQAAFTTAALAVGNHSITATYQGTATVAPSAAGLTQVVNRLPSTTTLSSSANPSIFGDPVTFTAVVRQGTNAVPGGTVTFRHGTTVIGTATTDANGRATVTTSSLAVGSHPISATFGGTPTVAGSTASLTQVVNRAPTTTALRSSRNPSTYGDPVTFTATVLRRDGSAATSGSVVFRGGGTTLAVVPVSNGVARFTTSSLSVGSHTITATYSGTATDAPSSASLTQTVDRIATKLVADPVLVRLSPTAIYIPGVSARLTTLSGTPIAGQVVRFRVNTAGYLCQAVTDSDGWARCKDLLFNGTVATLISVLNSGYEAVFEGSSIYKPSTGKGVLLQ